MTCPFSASRRRGRPARADAVMAREDILRQAFQAFARQGYDNVSQRQLAADCGVSDSLLHHHFGSKQQLWQDAVDSVFGPLMQVLQARLDMLASSGDAASTLRQNTSQAIKLMMTDPVALEFLFREGEGYRKFNRPFWRVWRVGSGRASAALGTDRAQIGGSCVGFRHRGATQRLSA